MVPKTSGQKMSWAAFGDYQWSYDLPNYMATFDGPTGITNQNMRLR
jgi:hypothetical protein